MNRSKDGTFGPKYTEEQFNLLVNTIRFGQPSEVYDYLNTLVKNEKTKWRLFDKAMKKAREINL